MNPSTGRKYELTQPK